VERKLRRRRLWNGNDAKDVRWLVTAMLSNKLTTWRHYLPKRGSRVSLPFACFACRKVFKRRVDFVRPTEKKQVCSQCAGNLWFTGDAFRAPGVQNAKQWRKAEALIRNGVLFWSNLGYRPTVLRQIAPFLKRVRLESPAERFLTRVKRVKTKKVHR
jgi:hypothetical protein